MRTCIVLYSLLTVLGLAGGFATAQDKAPPDPKREPDRLAIEKLTGEMIRAFEERDPAAVASHWTEGGEFIHNDGEPLRGRAEVQKGYAAYFRDLKGKPKLEVQSDGLRFPTTDMALLDTTLRLRGDDGEVVACGRQNAVLVREGGEWKVAVIREWDQEDRSAVSLNDLAWLIGTWEAVAPGRAVTVSYEWDEKRSFIRGKFTVKEGAKVVDSGMELIGKDNAEGVIRSWLFQSDGGFGSGVWAREGRKWTIDVHNVKADGSALTATLIYIRVDPNTFTWQGTNLVTDGEPEADTPPIKATKRASGK